MLRVRLLQHVARLIARLVVDYFDYAMRSGASARRAALHVARRRLLRLRHASRCLVMSRGSSGDSSRRSSANTSPPPRVRVPRHVARLVMRLVVDYFDYIARPDASERRTPRRAARRRLFRLRRASGCLDTSRRLVTDYFAYTARSGASARCAARCRLLRLRRASGCLGTLRGSSRRLVVDYFAYTVRPGASARRAARRRLLRLCRASGCLGMSRGSSRDSSRRLSSTTSPTPRVRLLQHIARLVA
jgi:hypothetical protein